jgi:hypothetical protein
MDKGDLFREAMKVFVRVQAGKRLAALGGKAPTNDGMTLLERMDGVARAAPPRAAHPLPAEVAIPAVRR